MIDRKFRKVLIIIPAILLTPLLCISCGSKKESLNPWPSEVQISYQNGKQLIVDETDRGEAEEAPIFSLDAVPDGVNPTRLYDWSPSGETIAYSSEGSIYFSYADGNNKKITSGANPRWSKDGKLISFVRSIGLEELSQEERALATENGIMMIGSLQVLNISDMKSHEVERGLLSNINWTHDSKQIAYSYMDPFSKDNSNTIVLLNVDTGERTILSEDLNDIRYISCSPVSDLLLIGSYWGKDRIKLMVCDYSSKEIRAVYSDDAVKEAEWSPDGQRIALSTYKTTELLYPNSIVIIGLDGSVYNKLDYDNPVWHDQLGYNNEICWSPDGQRIAFSRQYDIKHGVPDIYFWELSSKVNNDQIVYPITQSGNNHFPRFNPKP